MRRELGTIGAWGVVMLLAAAAPVLADPPPPVPPATGAVATAPQGAGTDRQAATERHPREAPQGALLFEPIRLHPQLPRWTALVHPGLLPRQLQFAFEPRIPGSVVVRYQGIEGYVVRQLRSRLRSAWRRQVRHAVQFRDPYDPTARAQMAEIDWAMRDHDAGGRWWERAWFYSLPPAKGGAPDRPYVHTVGRRITWRFGPLSVSNDLRIKLDPFAELRVEPDGLDDRDDGPAGALRARDHAHLGRADDSGEVGSVAATPGRVARFLLVPDTLDLVLTPDAQAGLFDGLHCRIRIRPRAKLGLKSDFEPKGELSVRADVDFLLGSDPAQAYPFGRLKADVRFRPLDRELLATVALVIPW